MSRLASLSRRHSKSSLRSDATYHSFHDIELFEPPMSSLTSATSAATSAATSPTSPVSPGCVEFEATEMRRQDSGYASMHQDSPPSKRRASATSSSASGGAGGSSSGARMRARPSVRRAAKSGPISHLPRSSAHSLYNRPQQQPQQPITYFHFPAPPEPPEDAEEPAALGAACPRPSSTPPLRVATSSSFDYAPRRQSYQQPQSPLRSETPTFPVPPQTTHYWTSDRTRRLEYAAIDAASRGVRGWVMRNIVPECFIPKERRHIGFDDDGGSVRRYRLDLDEDDAAGAAISGSASAEKESRGRRWRLWGSKTF
ncbi:hypothetical protein GGTG_02091 [Gaeumannomyces tritici R3-111a-1]|uniref:Uncharacterized protein n=1 Tax=Gaeumannomyces tritici (strain R3-111a-1) TaxID=644352 RepID=J3NLE2_GAET3|nr:hypothetical protein GGTG_02091 [Gaeumannomyces tritici R3-111a-1]EJT82117.1 hypothetical protein GGTG_02091 [Gaeumannomyces tritici R3-111a-1]